MLQCGGDPSDIVVEKNRWKIVTCVEEHIIKNLNNIKKCLTLSSWSAGDDCVS